MVELAGFSNSDTFKDDELTTVCCEHVWTWETFVQSKAEDCISVSIRPNLLGKFKSNIFEQSFTENCDITFSWFERLLSKDRFVGKSDESCENLICGSFLSM